MLLRFCFGQLGPEMFWGQDTLHLVLSTLWGANFMGWSERGLGDQESSESGRRVQHE